MEIMTVVNIISLFLLGKYALRLLADYRSQLKAGKDPEYHASLIQKIENETECW